MRWDVRRIIRELRPEDRQHLRETPADGLIVFHHGLGMGLRNAFRRGRYLGLSAYCHETVRHNGQSLSFDALSTVAIREIWDALQREDRE